MDSLNERLDKLRELIQNKDFLAGKGLSNEVNIRFFCYDPKEEMAIRHFVNQIMTDPTIDAHLIEYDLYKIFIQICEDLAILESISEMEEEDGSAYVLEQLHSAIGETEFIEKMRETETPVPGNVIILTGIGDVFPFMRVHKMLEAIQPQFPDSPILVFYPGEFDGNTVMLFKQLPANPYYRAFNIVGEGD